ncbi:MAG: DegQ family serine endoprotease [Rhodospirillales bacterium]|nr:DegQ family serine endoprotease [Rhodospirillales bacterium]
MTPVTRAKHEVQHSQGFPPFGALRASKTLAIAAAMAFVLVTAMSAASLARPMPQSFADLVEQVQPAVVTISVVQGASGAAGGADAAPGGAQPDLPFPPDSPYREFFERFFNGQDFGGQVPGMPRQPDRKAGGMGSGFILDPEGYVVTNNHVVAGAEEIKVVLKDGESFEATLVGSDEKTDLALLKVESAKPLPYVSFGDSDAVRVGDWVMAIGNPFGLGGTVTAGIVSARGRDLAGGSLVDFLQIDAPINRGNSGGPAFSDTGEVVGINTAIFTPNGGSVGIGFAIPSNLAAQVIADLREDGRVERGWLGVRIQPVTPDIAEGFGLEKPHGALIASVEEDSPAAAAGLEPGDVVLSWGQRGVERFKDLSRLVALTPAGETVQVEVWRNKQARTLEVTTGQLSQEEKHAAAAAGEAAAKQPMGQVIVPGTGLTLATLTPQLRERFGVPAGVDGVVVVEVEDYSPAAEQGLQVGDVIASVAMQPVADAKEAAARVEAQRADGSEVVMLMIRRQGGESFFALRLADA